MKPIWINGHDYTGYFTTVGYTVGYESVQGPNGGKMINGATREDELCSLAVVTLPCMPLTELQLSTLLSDIYSTQYPSLTYFDPRQNVTRAIYTRRSVSAQKYRGEGANGLEYWTGTVVTLAENPL